MINIAFGLDDNFARHCAATAASVLSNHAITSEESKIHFYFFGSLTEANKKNLLKLKKVQDFESTFIDVDFSEFEGLPLRNGQKIAIYNVLMIPVLMPETVKKVIYLDSDTIVNKDISELWNVDLGDHLLAAVEDNYRGKSQHFNSGVMVFNIPKLRSFSYYEKWKEYVKKHVDRMRLHDQDILNPVLRLHALYLPVNWNVHHSIFVSLYKKYNKKNIKEFISFCNIVHYSTKVKPWHPLPVHPLKGLYFKYLLMTPWCGHIEEYPKSAKVKKFLKLFFKYWYVHPAFFVKPKFWKEISKKGWLMTLY